MSSVYNTTIQQELSRINLNERNAQDFQLDIVELNVLNAVNRLIDGIDNTSNWVIDRINTETVNVTIDAGKDLRDLGYLTGKYTVNYRFFASIVGSPTRKACIIKAFSADRSEIRVIVEQPDTVQQFLQLQDLDKESILPGLVVKFSSDRTYSIRDFVVDNITYPESPFSVILKLNDGESFDTNLLINNQGWIGLELIKPLSEQLILLAPEEHPNRINARGPNFDAFNRSLYNDTTSDLSWDTILPTSGTADALIFSNLVSASYVKYDGVDYSKFENFIHFSSAEERLHNFRYKLQLIENYDQKIKDYSTNLTGLLSGSISGSSIYTDNVAVLNIKRQAVINSFDGFEYHLYFKSSSYESSSYGEIYPNTWPKQNNSVPYVLYSVSSSEATSWFNGFSESASRYDRNNVNALRFLLPEYIRENSANENALLFTDMLGQYFDTFFLSTQQVNNIHLSDSNPYIGTTKEVLRDLVRSIGLSEGVQSHHETPWDYILGDASGSRLSGDNREIELYHRLITNLPFLLRTKGTSRGLRALINCFGVPATILRVREFSGPIFSTTAFNIAEKACWYFRADNRFGHNQTFHVNITQPYNQIIFRFRFPLGINHSTTFSPILEYIRAGLSSNAYVQAKYVSSSYGDISCDTLSFSGPFYNGEWWTCIIDKNNTEAHLIQAKENEVIYHFSSSGLIKVPGGVGMHSIGDSIGGTGGPYVDYQNLQFLTSSFTSNNLLHEVALRPDTIISTYSTQSIYDCIAVFPLGINGVFEPISSSDPYFLNRATNTSISGTFFINSGSLISGSEVETLYRRWPNGIFSRYVNDKILIASNSLQENVLSLTERKEITADSTRDFYDSNKLGVFISTADDINEDIMQKLYNLNIGQFIGDPRDDYESSFNYGELERLKRLYFTKYKDVYNSRALFRLLTYFHSGLFDLVKQFSPVRSNTLTGLVVEPHLLHQNKIKQRLPSIENLNEGDALIDINNQLQLNGLYCNCSSSINIGADTILIASTQILSQSINLINTITPSAANNNYSASSLISVTNISGSNNQYNATELNTRILPGNYNLIRGSRYQFNTQYQQLPITISGFFALSDGGWNDPALSGTTRRVFAELKINNTVYNSQSFGIISTSIAESGNPAFLTSILSTNTGFAGFYATNNSEFNWDTIIGNTLEYIVVSYPDINSSSIWYPTTNQETIPAVPYWYSDGIMPTLHQNASSSRRQRRVYLYSSSFLAKTGQAFSSSLVNAEVNNVNLDYYRRRKAYFIGTKISGQINQPSTESFDGNPIVEIYNVDGNQIIPQSTQNNDGYLRIE